jgi:hypothetical protein
MVNVTESSARAKRMCAALVATFCIGVCLTAPGTAAQPEATKVPLIYCTDLFHPPDDPDDWFDLATIFSMEEFDIRGIVLDQGEKQKARSGRIPVEEMMVITGKKKVVSVYGLAAKLRSPSDKGLDQPAEFQAGVELILRVLRGSDKKVTLIAVGSLRDVCAAFNRDRQLLKRQVERLYVVAGHSDGGEEYNVQLDPHAYVGVMRSGLPICWLPCFGKEPHVCRWQFKQGDILDRCRLEVQNYFLYGLTRADPKKVDAILSLYKPIPEEVKARVWETNRAMWSTGAFIDAAGRAVVRKGGEWRAIPAAEGDGGELAFQFVPAKVTVNEQGMTRFQDVGIHAPDPNMRVFRFEGDFNEYNKAMKEALAGLLEQLGR